MNLAAAGEGVMGRTFPGVISHIAAAAPLMVMAIILSMGMISGAHLNPAVSITSCAAAAAMYGPAGKAGAGACDDDG
jgi:glycerol uptake facilitator-like aquaporin